MKRKIGLRLSKTTLFISLLLFTSLSFAQQGFTRADRDLLIEMRARLMGIDKRFEQVDKRFTELREDMNNRFEQVDNRFEQVDKRFTELREDMSKRFEQVDKRFQDILTFIGILAAAFGAITLGTISFALWDRKTMIRPFETKVAEINEKIAANTDILNNMCAFFKEYAAKNKTFAGIIRRFNLF